MTAAYTYHSFGAAATRRTPGVRAMQCNIDARGRAVRRNGGLLCCLLGAAAFGLAIWGVSRTASAIAGVVLLLAGLFQLFEACKGWCAIRAMGFKTPV